jgi:pyruvate,orthophosphate dikinase
MSIDVSEINVDNTIQPLLPCHIEILEKIDSAVADARKVWFTRRGAFLEIFELEEQLMTKPAYLALQVEYLRKGMIDDVEFLLRIRPDEISTRRPFDDSAFGIQQRAVGIAAFPGLVQGKLVLRTTDLRTLDNIDVEHLILGIVKLSPEDIHLLSVCSAAFSTTGGKTSHLALVCRGWGMPCVTGASQLRIDEANHRIFNGGYCIEENSQVILNGTTGQLYFGGEPRFSRFLSKEVRDHLAEIVSAMERATAPERFRKLSLSAQYRLANLKYILREMGAA